MRRRISSAVGGSNSNEMIVSVTLGAYMAAICSASCSVASLMLAGDPLPEASLVMPIAFLRLEGTHSAPSMHHEKARRILPVAKILGSFTYRISAIPLCPKFKEFTYSEARRERTLVRPGQYGQRLQSCHPSTSGDRKSVV